MPRKTGGVAILWRCQRLSGILKRMAQGSERQRRAHVVRGIADPDEANSETKSKSKKKIRSAKRVKEPTSKVRDLKARQALRTHRAVNAFVAKVDQSWRYEQVSADFRPGGSIWRNSGGKGKRRLRWAVHRADRLAQAGEFEAALRLLCGD